MAGKITTPRRNGIVRPIKPAGMNAQSAITERQPTLPPRRERKSIEQSEGFSLCRTCPDRSRVQSVQRHRVSLPPRLMTARIIATVPPPVCQSRYAGSVAAHSRVSEVVSLPHAGRSGRHRYSGCILSFGYVCPPRVAVCFGGFGMVLAIGKANQQCAVK